MNEFTLTATQVKYLNEFAIDNVCANLVEYNRTNKFRMEPTEQYDDTLLVKKSDNFSDYLSVYEYTNWINIATTYDVEDMQAEFIKATVKLSREIASVVENMIRFMAQSNPSILGNWRTKVPGLTAIDLFSKTDGSPNLKFMFVSNVPLGLEIDNPVLGWVSYKFKFSVFPGSF